MIAGPIIAAFALLTAQAPVSLDTLAAQVDEARLTYDCAKADSALTAVRAFAQANPAPEANRLRVEAALLCAELWRIDWERVPDSDFAVRRPLGEAIDTAAEEGLSALQSMEPTSETYRLHADLLAVMIRSDYRAKRYKKDMDVSAAKALELDPANAKAYVTQAKPFLFAPPNEGGDPKRALELLTKALELDPALESARCLRGLAYEKSGQPELAKADWELALHSNPACRPAQEELNKK